jgi:hypothetical protein
MSQESTGKGSAGSAQTSPSNKLSQGAQSPGQSPSTAQSQRDQSNQARDQGSQSKDKSNHAQSQPNTQRNQSSQAQGQGSMQKSGDQRNESTQAGRAGASGSTSTEASRSAANVALNNEQKTKIRETVINASSAPRVSSLNVSVSVGTVIPNSVRIVPVPSVLVEVNPRWRGYEYFVYNDEIILVHPRTHRIIAILPV